MRAQARLQQGSIEACHAVHQAAQHLADVLFGDQRAHPAAGDLAGELGRLGVDFRFSSTSSSSFGAIASGDRMVVITLRTRPILRSSSAAWRCSVFELDLAPAWRAAARELGELLHHAVGCEIAAIASRTWRSSVSAVTRRRPRR
jgi:hypothetical protein